MGLKLLNLGPLELHLLPIKYYEDLPSRSKVISGLHTDGQVI
jgi:hypothetical protein